MLMPSAAAPGRLLACVRRSPGTAALALGTTATLAGMAATTCAAALLMAVLVAL